MLVRKLIKLSPFVGLTLLNLAALSASATEGGISGGGGDARTEMRIDAIRADIQGWITLGGAAGLVLPSRLDLQTYQNRMNEYLASHAVVIGSVTIAEANALPANSERRVGIGDNSKTCKGFVSREDHQPHIVCNVERFAATSPADQYRLIHHEYAGLAGVERNVGASSDYELSQQLTEFLVPETVLRLAVRRPRASSESIDTIFGSYELVSEVMASGGIDCSRTLQLSEATVYGSQAPHIILSTDLSFRHPIYTELNEVVWVSSEYQRTDSGRDRHVYDHGQVTRRYVTSRSPETLTLDISIDDVSNRGEYGFTRAFRRNRPAGGSSFAFVLNRRTGLLTFTRHSFREESGERRNSFSQVCVMRRVGH